MLCVCAVENGTQGCMHARSALHQQSYVPRLNMCYFESERRSFLASPAIWFFPYFHSRSGEDVAVPFWCPILALGEIAFERLLNFLRTGKTAYLEKKVMNGRREWPTTSILLFCFLALIFELNSTLLCFVSFLLHKVTQIQIWATHHPLKYCLPACMLRVLFIYFPSQRDFAAVCTAWSLQGCNWIFFPLRLFTVSLPHSRL